MPIAHQNVKEARPTATAAPIGRRRIGKVSAIVGLGALTIAGLGAVPLLAQRAPGEQATIQTPFGRAPLSFADIAERVKPAVVSISVRGASAPEQSQPKGRSGPNNRRGEGIPGLPDDHPLNEFFRNMPKEFRGQPGVPGGSRPVQSQGSGFVISPDGYVVTNNHVIDGGGKITVVFDDEEKYDAELVGTDQRTDLALLRIKANKPLPFVRFAGKDARVGDWVLAVGNPFGLGGTVTAGIVSALARDIGSGPYDYLQIDASVNRGNSGGPTFNLDGEVIGINTAIYSPTGGNVGIAFAVPTKTAVAVIEQLKTSGSVSRGWLGVKIENIDEDKAAALGLTEPKGALVNEVTSNGPAAAAGLRVGDAILAVNGQKISDSRDLARKIAELNPSTPVDVKLFRAGREQTLPVKLGTFPKSTEEVAKLEEPKAPANTGTEVGSLGLSLLPAGAPRAAKDGVSVAEVTLGSDAANKGLKAGDVILEVNSQKVASPAEIEAAVKSAQSAGRNAVILNVRSGEQKRLVAVRLKAKG